MYGAPPRLGSGLAGDGVTVFLLLPLTYPHLLPLIDTYSSRIDGTPVSSINPNLKGDFIYRFFFPSLSVISKINYVSLYGIDPESPGSVNRV